MSLPTSPFRSAAPAIALAALLGAGLSIHLTTRPAPRALPDPCALPSGVQVAPADRSLVTRRALACRDLEHHRISLDEYQAAIQRLDTSPAPTPPPEIDVEPAPVPLTLWGSTVRDRSTEYTSTSWAASQALGAPDVHPENGDHENAWASLGADDRIEHLEVGFDQPRHLSGVEVFETYNPGAVTQIELIAEDGRRWTVHRQAASAPGEPSRVLRTSFLCTDAPIVAIRLTIDSPAIPGWNEIDAIGGVTCDGSEPVAMAL